MRIYLVVNTKQKDLNQEVSIRIRIKEGSVDQAVATGEKVKLVYWNLNKQEFTRAAFKGKEAMLTRLARLKTHLLECAAKEESIQPGWLNEVVDKYRFPSKHLNKVNLPMYDWMRKYIDGLRLNKRTVYKYKIMLDSLIEFDPGMSWEDLNQEFYLDYVRSLEDRGWAKNTIFDRMKVIKAIAQAGYIHKQNRFDDFKNFKLYPEESDSVYLSESEILRIRNVNLSRHEYLVKDRDLFIVMCWVGCRFSDLHKVNTDNIKNNRLYFKQTKTKGSVVLPLHPDVKEILDKYDGQLPKLPANQIFNRALKLIAKAAGLRQKETKGITKGGIYRENQFEKWELVTSHTARRSFATNLYKQGVDVMIIMKMTGHKSLNSFLKYIKVTEEEYAGKLELRWNEIYNEAV